MMSNIDKWKNVKLAYTAYILIMQPLKFCLPSSDELFCGSLHLEIVSQNQGKNT